MRENYNRTQKIKMNIIKPFEPKTDLGSENIVEQSIFLMIIVVSLQLGLKFCFITTKIFLCETTCKKFIKNKLFCY